jgi:hypothetical protein
MRRSPYELVNYGRSMSATQHQSSIEDTFSQVFNFNEKKAPYGATLDELLESCLYVASTPSTFCAGTEKVFVLSSETIIHNLRF